jgi:hypothetical protein
MPRAGAHALLTRPPLGATPKDDAPFDLHVLGAPPAFVLSQDQTLSFIFPKGASKPKPAANVPFQERPRQVEPTPPGDIPGRHRRPRRSKPLGITSATRRPKGPRVLFGHPQGPKAPRILKGHDELPQTPIRHPRGAPPGPRTDVRKNVTSDAPGTSSPTPGRRPRIPSCLFPTLSNSRRCGAGHPASAPLSGTRYIVSSPPRLKALFTEIRFVNLGVQVLDPTLRIS